MSLFADTTEAYTHNGDADLLRKLGLKTTGFKREWTDLGTVVVQEAEESYGVQRPEATVKVEVTSMPAMFWRFTVTRPRDEIEELGEGKWRPVFEPVEVRVMTTGSGGFVNYWPMAKMIAEHMLDVEVVA